jgi:transcriptional regulator of acetoin/glycerol metabolism
MDELPPEFRTPGETRADDPVPDKTRSRYRRTAYELETDEAEEIRNALQQAGGRIDEAARITGMSRATFWRKRKRYGV